MKKLITVFALLWALCAGATNITNYPVRTTFNANYWFFLSDVPNQTNWNLPGNYVASSADLNTVSNMLYNYSNSMVLITNLYASNAYIDNITVTNGITNLSLTPNTSLKADANKRITSIANGSGALTNNGAGVLGWFPFTSLSVTTNFLSIWSTNAWFTNAYINYIYGDNIYGSNILVDNITVTNGITNLSLTVNTVLKADGNKRIVSIPNGTGALTNDNAGNFGWYGYASGSDILTFSNNITTTIGTTVNDYSNNVNTVINSTSNSILTQIATSNTFNQVYYLTNTCTMAPDFAKGYCWISTNAAFAFLSPLNLDYTKAQTTVMIVTNSSGTAILATMPANVHLVPGSAAYITNASAATFFHYPYVGTNCYLVPLF